METSLTAKHAICIDNVEHPASLELHELYRNAPDDEAAADGDLRIIDESGEDYLYPAKTFVQVELPQTTVRVLAESFERYLASA